MKNINENELRNYIFKKLQESHFDELGLDDDAMKAAMEDIKASGEKFQPLGDSKFEKDPKFTEKFKDALKRANLELPSDETEVEYLAQMMKDRKGHEEKFGVGSLNEIEDADGKSIKLNSQVQHKNGAIGYVERLIVGDDGEMLVKVNWIGSKKAEPIAHPEKLIVTQKEKSLDELNKSTYNNAAAGALSKGDKDLALDFLSHSNEMGIEDDEENHETSRYMFFSNLQQIRRQAGLLLDLDEDEIQEILENGHDWAQDHIATAKETIDQVFDFLMNETKSGDMWKSVDLEDREDEMKDEMDDEIEEGMGHSHTIGHGANKKPVNYPEELMEESFISEDEHHTLSFLDKIRLKLAGVSEKKALENLNNGLPIDWTGSVEGYYDREESRRDYSGTNEGLEEDMDKTDYNFNKEMLDYETQQDFYADDNSEEDGDRYEQVIFLQDHEADHALNILKQDGEDEAIEYLMQWHQPGNHETSEETGFGLSDKTYEKDGYIMSWNPTIGYIGLVHDLKPNTIEEDSQRKRHTAGQIGKVSKNIPLGQNSPHSDSAEGL